MRGAAIRAAEAAERAPFWGYISGAVCDCGAVKRRGQTFCNGCIERLAPWLQDELEFAITYEELDYLMAEARDQLKSSAK